MANIKAQRAPQFGKQFTQIEKDKKLWKQQNQLQKYSNPPLKKQNSNWNKI